MILVCVVGCAGTGHFLPYFMGIIWLRLAPAQSQIDRVYQWYRWRNSEFADRWFRGLMNAI